MTPDEIIEVLRGREAGRKWEMFSKTKQAWTDPVSQEAFPSNEFGLLMGCSMCDLLKAAETVIDEYKGVPSPHFHSLLVKLEEAIAATKARSEWVPVAKGLPVVPEGCRKVDIWGFTRSGEVVRTYFSQGDTQHNFSLYFTHWMCRQDDTPAPPKENV